MTSSSPAAAPSGEARPVDAGERLVLLDALRGFALCGVFVSNVYLWFSGRAFLPPAQLKAAIESASWLDTAAMHAVMFLVFGKFITIFSFLFGLGFAVQMGRAEERGASIAPLYARRLAVLFVIGVSHLLLLWYGDILSTYAFIGFWLLLFRQRSDRTLLTWAAVCILVVPVLGTVVMKLPTLLAGSPEAAAAVAKAASERTAALKAQTLEAFMNGTWFQVVRANATYFVQDFIKPLLTLLLVFFGRFLLGLLAGRRRLFHDVPQHLPLFRKVFKGGLVLGIVGGGLGVLVQQLFMRKVLLPESLPWLPYVMGVVRQLGEVGLAAVYVSGFTLLFQREAWQRVLSVLAPVGRMALTNYLSQTLLSVGLFYGYGLGLIGKVGPALSIAIALGIFTLQVGVSHLWLARFRFGPAEWLWRSLTYGKAQPLRRAPEPTVAPAVAA
jgi:uncharacterized protein